MKKQSTPLIAGLLLRRMSFYNRQFGTIGDIEEEYFDYRQEFGRSAAWAWYWFQTLQMIFHYVHLVFYWSTAMFKNYFKTAVRNMTKAKTFSLINISGLVLGFTCCLLIFLYIQFELSYDNYHEKSNNIYRVYEDIRTDTGTQRTFSPIPPPCGPALEKDYPEIVNAVRFYSRRNVEIVHKDKMFYESSIYFTDPDVFDTFTFQFVSGDPATSLRDGSSMVITETAAYKYFGDDDPIGKTVAVNGTDFTVSAVIEDIPYNSHFRFDFLGSLNYYNDWEEMENWYSTMFYTFIEVADNVNIDALSEKIRMVAHNYVGEVFSKWGEERLHFIQPLRDVYFNPQPYQNGTTGNMTNIRLLSVIACLTLVIALMNFINLSTARSAKRAKEVGLRKVVGAIRAQMVRQFLLESVLMSTAALFLSLLVVHLALPYFNDFFGKAITIDYASNFQYLLGIILLAGIAGVFAGMYPAFYLTAHSPVTVFRGLHESGKKDAGFRQWLVIIQFGAAVCLIISALTIYSQLNFLKNRDLGFDSDQNLVIHFKGKHDFPEKYKMLKEVFGSIPGVTSTAVSNTVPGRSMSNYAFSLLDEENNMNQSMYYMMICPDFIPHYDIDIMAGRNFSVDISTDNENTFMINEAGVRAIGLNNPEEALGKQINTGYGRSGYIIGVVKDFNFRKLNNSIEPVILTIRERSLKYLTLKVSTESMPRTIESIQSNWTEIYPEKPFEYFFLDDDFNRQYQSEEKMGKIFTAFTCMALLIAALGLYGLSIFIIEQKMKEIGIRKVLGAKVVNIMGLLTGDFVKWVAAANIIAWPIAWYAMSKWLEGFAYRIELSFLVFLLTFVAVFAVALFTSGIQSLRAANLNPVESLRNE